MDCFGSVWLFAEEFLRLDDKSVMVFRIVLSIVLPSSNQFTASSLTQLVTPIASYQAKMALKSEIFRLFSLVFSICGLAQLVV